MCMCKNNSVNTCFFQEKILKLDVVEGFALTVELFLALFSSPQGLVHCFPFVGS